MKKISLFIVAILLIIPLSVSAAETVEYNVESLSATSTSGAIKYNGTMETGSTAVKCWLYEGTTELNYYSSAVDNTKFDGTFTVSKNGEYTVKCANYEGGNLKEATVKVGDVEEDTTTNETTTEETKTSSKSKNPKTNDNILKFVSLMGISLIGLALIVFKLKKEAK